MSFVAFLSIRLSKSVPMYKDSLKVRIFLFFASILLVSMLLQTAVVFLLGIRKSIENDLTWTKQILLEYSNFVSLSASVVDDKYLEGFFDNYKDIFSCIVFELEGEIKTVASPCRYPNKLIEQSQQSKIQQLPLMSFSDEDWGVQLIKGNVALISVPLKNQYGKIQGSINVEQRRQSFFSEYSSELIVGICYLLINTITFSILSFFRLISLIFKPLDRIAQLAETQYLGDHALLIFSDNESSFRKISNSLNALIDRIKRDNCHLELTVRELEEANRELKAQNELVIRSEKLASVGRLSAGLAHEIGNPLSIIQGYVEMLGKKGLSEIERRQFSDKSQKELDKIKLLIRQLLDFSRPTGLQKSKVKIHELLSEVICFMTLQRNASVGSIQSRLFAERDEILAEKNALEQLFVNIVFNAIDAIAEKTEDEKEIIVETQNVWNPNSDPTIVILIKDNGIGIVKDHIEKIFDPFFTTKEVGKGTGLGLFVCHTIVDRFGGKIWINNREHHGVEVKIELPLPDNPNCSN